MRICLLLIWNKFDRSNNLHSLLRARPIKFEDRDVDAIYVFIYVPGHFYVSAFISMFFM